MYDYHIHSTFSLDGKNSLDDMVESAYRKGAKEICITDHIELSSPFGDEVFNVDNYFERIDNLRNKYLNMNIKKGIEIGVQQDNLDRMDEFVNSKNFDFVLASVHSSDGFGVHDELFIEGKTWDNVIESYYNEIYTCAKNFKNYQILGHIDLIKRYYTELGNMNFKNHYGIIDEILKLVIEDGKGIEVNTGGIRYPKCNNINPTKDILERYKKLGGEIITFGSDSHDIDSILYGYNETIDILKTLNYKYLSIFENGQVDFVKI